MVKTQIGNCGCPNSAMDSIDDIFASKSKSTPLQPLTKSVKKKRSDKKKKRDPFDPKPKPLSNKRRPPETVVDPSSTIPGAKRTKVQKPKNKHHSEEEQVRFEYSRGSGPRTCLIPPQTSSDSSPRHRSQDGGRVLDIQRR